MFRVGMVVFPKSLDSFSSFSLIVFSAARVGGVSDRVDEFGLTSRSSQRRPGTKKSSRRSTRRRIRRLSRACTCAINPLSPVEQHSISIHTVHIHFALAVLPFPLSTLNVQLTIITTPSPHQKSPPHPPSTPTHPSPLSPAPPHVSHSPLPPTSSIPRHLPPRLCPHLTPQDSYTRGD